MPGLRPPPADSTYSPTPRRTIDDAAYWLERAEELQAIGEGMTHPDTRAQMLKLAQTYKQMAERAYQLARNE